MFLCTSDDRKMKKGKKSCLQIMLYVSRFFSNFSKWSSVTSRFTIRKKIYLSSIGSRISKSFLLLKKDIGLFLFVLYTLVDIFKKHGIFLKVLYPSKSYRLFHYKLKKKIVTFITLPFYRNIVTGMKNYVMLRGDCIKILKKI